MLADEILANRDPTDVPEVDGFVTGVANAITKAQRFDLHDDVVDAAMNLANTSPSSLVEMQPFCRLPYPKIWIEWRMEADAKAKAGCLLESVFGPQTAFATFVWIDETGGKRAIDACPLALRFDWREESALSRREMSTDDLIKLMGGEVWRRCGKSETEIRAAQKLDTTAVVSPSPHAGVLFRKLESIYPEAERRQFGERWANRLNGKPSFLIGVITLFNCRNGLAREPVDRAKVNKHRIRSGKPPLLPYVTTTMKLSASQHADAQGVDRATARQHLVRGHLKNIRGNLYWWSPHLRGDPRLPVTRQKYLVK